MNKYFIEVYALSKKLELIEGMMQSDGLVDQNLHCEIILTRNKLVYLTKMIKAKEQP